MQLNLRTLLILVLLALFIFSVPIVEFKLWFNQPAVVQFDLKGTTQLFADSLSKQSLTIDSRQLAASEFAKSLQNVINQYELNHHVIVLVSPAVVAGAPDITTEIKAELVDMLGRGKK